MNFKQMEKQITELKKENATLKESVDFWEERYWILNDIYKEVVNENKNKLTKAKELLKRYVKIYVNPYPEEEIELRNEAEQFLKE